MKTIRITIRLSEEAHQIIMQVPPKIRSKMLSEIILRAKDRGCVDAIRQRESKELLRSIGLSLDDIRDLMGEERPSTPSPPSLPNGEPYVRQAPKEEPSDKPLQEKLDKLVDF
ncbi:hypothetical protein SAMN02746041_01845 [Desulfacinum hydrothermale DSM 13146]|uniref:Uncharacterized protein n=1 Tax=Desulfacinum hydrothermale DSM 13146 TaxID=1121390 RepID=A0A1W1XIH1_9BACT|nr:hypothetical protein [Desulfacinum hydrothermale]SMC23775.1 hypothetical protein SAMN02746041_01845 [Desulfacinum hydrothermale DSM 13146]